MSDDFRARVLDAMHRSLHELGVRIPVLTEHPGDHCNLVAEVALDALLPVLAEGIKPHRWDHDHPDSTPPECGVVHADTFYSGVLHAARVVRELLPPVVRDPSPGSMRPADHQCDGEFSWCWPCEYRERLRDPSQTSTGVDALPADRAPSPSAQSAAADAGRAADAPGPYPSSAIPSDGA